MTFYFYDLETTSGSPRSGRIMQFAGQRTDEKLQPIAEPHNLLIKLADDVLPEPDAILVHGITPQQTLQDGITEAEFARLFHEEIALANTIFIGYNNIRFDDEFMRHTLYRTFYDPYQWHWLDGKSRWDLLDPMRMMRALRPDGLKWPTIDSKPTVKLELMAKENQLNHTNAHDALSDVTALIELARLFHQAQPKLFDYLLSMRDKKKVAKFVEVEETFLYTSGKYSSEYEKTTIVAPILKHPRRDASIVFDLREDPHEWVDKSVDELITHWKVRYGDDKKPLPVKTLQYNRCPAIAPLSVLDAASADRIKIDLSVIERHKKILEQHADFTQKLQQALDKIEDRQQTSLVLDDVDTQLYDGFWSPGDQSELSLLRAADPSGLTTMLTTVKNKRIRAMIPRYKARNFPALLDVEEREQWEAYRRKLFYGDGKQSLYASFSKRMQEIAATRMLTERDQYLLTELQLYAESILPEPNDEAL